MAGEDESKGGSPPADRARGIKLFTKDIVDQIVGAVRSVVSPIRPPIERDGAPDQWFGPGEPAPAIAPKDEVAGRQFDYPTAFNLTARPRSYEPISFPQLRSLADSYDLLRLAIETRKDQMSKLEWSILPRKHPAEDFRRRADDRCQVVEAFFRKPDKIHHWQDWVRMLVEEQLVTDAPAVYLRRDQGGRPWAIEPIDGATLVPLVDGTGRRPMPPDPAYVQILKGVPAAHYNAEELMYFPRNPRTWKVYGLSPVEQIVMTVNIGLRRMTKQLETYTTGNVPDALISVPESWTSQQIQEYQRYWDALMETNSQRRKAKFVPGGLAYQPTLQDNNQMSPFDEWLARVVCYCLSLPPLPFVKVMNRATAQTSYETAMEEGLAPMMQWFKNAVDDMISAWFGFHDLELVWDNVRKMDPTDQANLNLNLMQRGIKSLDEIRAEMGLEPLGLGHVIFGIGPLGVISIESLNKAIKLGLDMPPMPMAPEMMGPDGMPMPGGAGTMDPKADILAGVPPELLRAVGLDEVGEPVDGEEGVDGDDYPDPDNPFGDEEDDGLDDAVAHPEIADILRETERKLGR